MDEQSQCDSTYVRFRVAAGWINKVDPHSPIGVRIRTYLKTGDPRLLQDTGFDVKRKRMVRA